mmetsp:Transcript_48316/g.103605  ORF Transcript_48316/g.103605 Transcript_48316/m.103605 type:complete len:354 (+) Transcript_48316:391-1452(+)
MPHWPIVDLLNDVIILNTMFGCGNYIDDRCGAHDETKDIVEEEVAEVATRPAAGTGVVNLDLALQRCAALLLGPIQHNKRGPDQHDLEKPTTDNDFYHTRRSWACCVALMPRVICRDGDATEVRKVSDNSADDAPGEELRALELQDEGDQLVLVKLIYDAKDEQEHQWTQSGNGQERDDGEDYPHRVFQLAPDGLVEGEYMVPQEGKQTTSRRCSNLLLAVPIDQHSRLNHDLFTDVGPHGVDGAVLGACHHPWHVWVVSAGFQNRGDVVHDRPDLLLQLLLHHQFHELLELLSFLVHVLLHLGSDLGPLVGGLLRHGARSRHSALDCLRLNCARDSCRRMLGRPPGSPSSSF